MTRRQLVTAGLGLLGIGAPAVVLAKMPPKRSDDRESDRNRQGLTEAELDEMSVVSMEMRVTREFVASRVPNTWAALDEIMQAFIDYAPAFLVGPIADYLNPFGYKYTVHVPEEWHDALWNEAMGNRHDGPGAEGLVGLSWRGKVDISPSGGESKDGRIFYVSLVREDA